MSAQTDERNKKKKKRNKIECYGGSLDLIEIKHVFHSIAFAT